MAVCVWYFRKNYSEILITPISLFSARNLLLFTVMEFLFPLCFTVISLFPNRGGDIASALAQRQRLINAEFQKIFGYLSYVLVYFFVITSSFAFVLFVYPNIPQTFGGGAPREATIDVIVDKLPLSTVVPLLGRRPAADEKLVTSRSLLIYSVSNNSVTLSLTARIEGKPWELLEIKQWAIVAIHWSQ